MVSSSVGLMIWLAIGGVASMISRYRESDSLVRTQIKWVVYASGFAAASVASISLNDGNSTIFLVQTLTAQTAIPLAIAIAITQYKLFEIDRLISRTLSYGLVLALLGAVFATLTWLPVVLLGGSGKDSTQPPAIIAVSTLAVAALFNPLRRRVQKVIDRRFNRTAYEVEIISGGFASRLEGAQTTSQMVDETLRTVNRSLQPEASGIWIKPT
jgi:hypothetical protein